MSETTATARWITGIDHPVIAVRDMTAAHAAYKRLGFTIPPRGSHLEWGTGNWCVMFEHDYMELRGIVKEGQTHNLDEFLEKNGEGLMGVAFGTEDAAASHEALVEREFNPQPVKGLTRNFELPEGWLQPRFSLCFLEERETAGLMSVVFCQHLTPELIRRPQWLKHANGACGVLALTGCVSDLELAAKTHERLFGREALQCSDGWLQIDTGHRQIVLSTADEIRRCYPEAESILKGAPRLVAVTLESKDMNATTRTLAERGVSFRRARDGSLLVPPSETCGVVLEFAAKT